MNKTILKNFSFSGDDDRKCHFCKDEADVILTGKENCHQCGNEILFCFDCLEDFFGVDRKKEILRYIIVKK